MRREDFKLPNTEADSADAEIDLLLRRITAGEVELFSPLDLRRTAEAQQEMLWKLSSGLFPPLFSGLFSQLPTALPVGAPQPVHPNPRGPRETAGGSSDPGLSSQH